jgi:hypothetical protein
MCVQLGLEGRSPNFHEFWSEEVHCIKDLPKINLRCLKL